jgi:hypothetical protein
MSGTAGQCESENGMSNAVINKPIRLITGAASGPYIMVHLDHLDRVRKALEEHKVPHWVDHQAISVNDGPFVIVINLGEKVDAGVVQELLDRIG